MSKNFELSGGRATDLTAIGHLQLDLQARAFAVPVCLRLTLVHEGDADWLRAIAVLRKHWQLFRCFSPSRSW